MFLKVKLNSLGVSASERIRAEIEGVYKDTVKSVEICKEPRRVRSTKTGVLNIPHNTVLTIYDGNPKHFTRGTNINLAIFPELEPLCELIRTEWDFDSIPVGSLVEIVTDDNKNGFGLYAQHPKDKNWIKLDYYVNYGDGIEGRGYNKSAIKSIRIIELPKEDEKEN